MLCLNSHLFAKERKPEGKAQSFILFETIQLIWKIIKNQSPTKGNFVVFCGWTEECKNKQSIRTGLWFPFPPVITQPKLKKKSFTLLTESALPPALLKLLHLLFSDYFLPCLWGLFAYEGCGIPGVWRCSHFSLLIPELSVTKNSSIYFESGNNAISLPACITPRCLKQFYSNFLPTHLWAETKQAKFGPPRTIFPRSWEQVEAQLSDETYLTIVICPLCISGLLPPRLLGMPSFSFLSIILAVPHSLPLACWSSGMKQRL